MPTAQSINHKKFTQIMANTIKTVFAVIMHSDEMQDSVLLFKTFDEAVSCVFQEYEYNPAECDFTPEELRKFLSREQYVRIGSWDYTIQSVTLPDNI